jgi:hypothetical protein
LYKTDCSVQAVPYAAGSETYASTPCNEYKRFNESGVFLNYSFNDKIISVATETSTGPFKRPTTEIYQGLKSFIKCDKLAFDGLWLIPPKQCYDF